MLLIQWRKCKIVFGTIVCLKCVRRFHFVMDLNFPDERPYTWVFAMMCSIGTCVPALCIRTEWQACYWIEITLRDSDDEVLKISGPSPEKEQIRSVDIRCPINPTYFSHNSLWHPFYNTVSAVPWETASTSIHTYCVWRREVGRFVEDS